MQAHTRERQHEGDTSTIAVVLLAELTPGTSPRWAIRPAQTPPDAPLTADPRWIPDPDDIALLKTF